MQYKVSKNTKTTFFVLWVCLLFTAVTFILPTSFQYYKWAFQLVCLILAIADVQITIRYVLSDYLYFLDGNMLKIYKITGKKSICVLSVSLADIKSEILSKQDYKSDMASMKLNYCKNIAAKERKYLLFRFNGTDCSLCFEPNDEFCRVLSAALKDLPKENEDE